MKRIILVLVLMFCLINPLFCVAEKTSFSLSKDFLREFSQKDLDDLNSFILDSVQNDSFIHNMHEFPDSRGASYNFYEVLIEDMLNQSIFVSSNVSNNDEYVSSMVIETNLPFGDQMHSSQIYINTINDYVASFGSPEYTFNDETNKLMRRNSSVSWYIDEYNVTLTVLYCDGDVVKARFPCIETSLFQGDLRIK